MMAHNARPVMTSKRPPRPLDEDALRELALRYVGRFATSRGKLLAYLARKLRERGWGGEAPADPEALVARFAELGYVDDSSFALMKSAALGRRGYGARRVTETLRAAGIEEADRGAADAQAQADRWAAADRFARRKRIGPYAMQAPDPKGREKAIAAFLRAGPGHNHGRRWVDAAPGDFPDAED